MVSWLLFAADDEEAFDIACKQRGSFLNCTRVPKNTRLGRFDQQDKTDEKSRSVSKPLHSMWTSILYVYQFMARIKPKP